MWTWCSGSTRQASLLRRSPVKRAFPEARCGTGYRSAPLTGIGPSSGAHLVLTLLIAECRAAVGLVLANKVGLVDMVGWVEVYSYSKHWVCLFPQHGRGAKHTRQIALADWQHDIAIARYPYLLLRGLTQSDGWRGTNRIAGRYEYPRLLVLEPVSRDPCAVPNRMRQDGDREPS